tara:strand:+ start:212 stop:436 length:225 start_codon:yes stop_codon:yes gene_type:complete
MDRIGWTDLLQSISRLGSPNVGKQPNMSESVKETTTVNFGGIFVMGEGQALIMIMIMVVTFTLALNTVVQGIIG